MKKKLGSKPMGRKARHLGGNYKLRENILPYDTDFYTENDDMDHKTAYKWNTFPEISKC